MPILGRLITRLKATILRDRDNQQMNAEIDLHLELLKEHYIRCGDSAEEAYRKARLQFGSPSVLKERHWSMRGYPLLTEVWRDLRFALRMLRKNWLSSCAIVIAIALGLGLNGAVFTFVNALLLRAPGGVPASGQLMEVWLHSRNASGFQSYVPFDYPDFFYYRSHLKSFEELLAFDGDAPEAIWNQSGSGRALRGQLVSGNFFSGLRVNACLGRTLSPDDDRPGNQHPSVVLSYSFWKSQMESDPQVIGRRMLLNGAEFIVVGVGCRDFSGLLIGSAPDFWAPLATQETFIRDKGRAADRNGFWLIVAGRLAPGVSQAQAQAELKVVSRQLEILYPDAQNQMDPLLYRANLVPGPYRGYVAAFTGLLLGLFLLVLIIACANATGLLLARAAGRAREMAIRSAVGASRAHLIMQMLIESLLLAALAGAAAIGFAWTFARLLLLLKPASLPITLDLPLDWHVLFFILAAALLAGLLFGLVPALRGSMIDPAPVLKEETPGGSVRKTRLRLALLIGQIALSVVLLTGASLCVRSLLNASSIDPGFENHHMAMAQLDPGVLGYSPEKAQAFFSRYLAAVRQLPEVTAASYTDFLPLGAGGVETSAGTRVGDDRIAVHVFRVDREYFKTMGIPLLTGRDFTGDEVRAATAGVVIVNEYLARQLWPGRNPIGQHIALGGDKSTSEVIGIAKSGKYRTLGERPAAAVYRVGLPSQRTLLVRTVYGDRAMLTDLQRLAQSIDPIMAATRLQTIEDYMALPLFPARATGLLFGFSGLLALVLTTIGLFGVIAYVVSQRTHEIGVRMALGARRSDVLKLVGRQGLSVTLTGLVLGTAGSLAASRLLAPFLYGVSATSLVTLVEVCVALALVALLACYLPARKAMRIDPVTALRYE